MRTSTPTATRPASFTAGAENNPQLATMPMIDRIIMLDAIDAAERLLTVHRVQD